MNAVRWTGDEYRAFLRKASVQLPLGRGVEGLDKPRRIVTSPYEAAEAEALMRWADGEGRVRWPELEWLHHVPNGGWRSWSVAKALQRQGVKPGPWDYVLDVPRLVDVPRLCYHGARLELKRRTGGGLSPDQKRWGEHYKNSGYWCIVARGWEEARDGLIEYLTLEET